MNWKDRRIVCYDFETTGLNPAQDQVIEVATLTIEHGEVVDSQQWFVACPEPLRPIITELTGITDADLIGGLSLLHSAVRLHNIIKPQQQDLLLVGHNILRFDNQFLRVLFSRMNIAAPNIDEASYDTCTWTKVDRLGIIPPAPEHRTAQWQKQILDRRTHVKSNLAAALEYYGVKLDGPLHRAQHDVAASFEIAKIQWMRQRMREDTARLMMPLGSEHGGLFEEVVG